MSRRHVIMFISFFFYILLKYTINFLYYKCENLDMFVSLGSLDIHTHINELCIETLDFLGFSIETWKKEKTK